MLVHFPIVLLLLATIARLVSLFLKGQHRHSWRYMSRVALYAGVPAAWIGIYTGDLAHSEVTRSLCDPTILKTHENTAYTLAWLFTVAALLDGILYFYKLPLKYFRLQEAALLVLMLIGTVYLAYSGHLGASLVYQQAAGVHRPTQDCSEFQ